MTEPDEGTVVARFQVTPDEMYDAIIALGQLIYGLPPSLSRFAKKYGNWLLAVLASLLTILVLFVGTVIIVATGLGSANSAFLIITSLCWGAALFVSWLNRFQKRRMRAALAQQNFNSVVTVTDNGPFLSWDSEAYKYSWQYDRFDTLIPYKGGYYLVTGLAGLFIPGHAFVDAAAKTRFETILKKKMRPDVVDAFFEI
jgi:hypothetical protein